MKEIEQLMKQVHQNATDKQFWKEYDDVMERMKINKWPPEMIEGVHQTYISKMVALIGSEVSEAIEALRNKNTCDIATINGLEYSNLTAVDFEQNVKDTFEDELADVIIRVFDLSKKLKINLPWHIKTKMAYNSTRPPLHGKAF
jgi:NTP pyrophosphatase (non-canonical NTP hydrolase)